MDECKPLPPPPPISMDSRLDEYLDPSPASRSFRAVFAASPSTSQGHR